MTTQPVLPWRPSPLLGVSAGVHLAGAVALALSPVRWPFVVGTIVADHLAVVAAGLAPRSRLLGPNMTRLPAEASLRREVGLTFDDGPDTDATPRVLDILDAHGARATFFCIGKRVEGAKEIAAEIARRGHRVENHSHLHRHSFFFHSPSTLRREIQTAQESIEKATGRRPRLFRAPAGIRGPLLDAVLVREGLTLVSWTRRGFDAVSTDPARVLSRLLAGLSAGDVLLLHDGNFARDRGTGSPVVLEVLPRLLDALAARSLRAVRIDP